MPMSRLIVLVIAALYLTACSSTRFAYRNADWFINWAVDDYVELNRPQQLAFDAALDRWLAWHCAHELPKYQHALQKLSETLAEDAGQPLTDASLQAFSDNAVDAWFGLVLKALDETLSILKSLDDRQVVQILEELADRNQRFYREYVAIDASELEQLRLKRVREAMKRWAGSINKDQTALAAEWARRADNVYRLIYERREQWRRQVALAMADRSQGDFAAALTGLLLHADQFYGAAERDRLRANQTIARQLLLALERSLSERQREHLLAELAKITEDIERLSTSECR